MKVETKSDGRLSDQQAWIVRNTARHLLDGKSSDRDT